MSGPPPGPGWWLASDGRWYPPTSPPPPPGPPPQPVIVQQKSSNGCLIALGVVIALALLGGCGVLAVTFLGASDLYGPAPPSEATPTVETCAENFGTIKATGTLVNHTSRTRSFNLTVQFVDGNGAVIDTDSLVSVRSIGPGQTGRWEAATVRDASSDFKCNVTRVERNGS